MHYIFGMAQSISIRLNDELAEALDEQSRRANRSRGQIVRDALAEHLAGGKSTALGALGKYTGTMRGPKDLSTNKKHLAGMGRKRR